MLALIPAAKVGHIGLYRNEETLEPVEYYCKLPKDIAEREVIVLDPMLATGGSAIDAITQIKKRGATGIVTLRTNPLTELSISEWEEILRWAVSMMQTDTLTLFFINRLSMQMMF